MTPKIICGRQLYGFSVLVLFQFLATDANEMEARVLQQDSSRNDVLAELHWLVNC